MSLPAGLSTTSINPPHCPFIITTTGLICHRNWASQTIPLPITTMGLKLSIIGRNGASQPSCYLSQQQISHTIKNQDEANPPNPLPTQQSPYPTSSLLDIDLKTPLTVLKDSTSMRHFSYISKSPNLPSCTSASTKLYPLHLNTSSEEERGSADTET